MNATEVLRIVDAIHRDKNIEKEIVFQAIEAALAGGMHPKARVTVSATDAAGNVASATKTVKLTG